MSISGCKLLTRNARTSSITVINTEAETQVNQNVYRGSFRGKLGSEKGEKKIYTLSLIPLFRTILFMQGGCEERSGPAPHLLHSG